MSEPHHFDVIGDQTPPQPIPEVMPSIKLRGLGIILVLGILASLGYGYWATHE